MLPPIQPRMSARQSGPARATSDRPPAPRSCRQALRSGRRTVCWRAGSPRTPEHRGQETAPAPTSAFWRLPFCLFWIRRLLGCHPDPDSHPPPGRRYPFDATAMCKAARKLFGNWRQNAETDGFLKVLSSDIGIPITELIQSVRGTSGNIGKTVGKAGIRRGARGSGQGPAGVERHATLAGNVEAAAQIVPERHAMLGAGLGEAEEGIAAIASDIATGSGANLAPVTWQRISFRSRCMAGFLTAPAPSAARPYWPTAAPAADPV
jgi:hypothetical protein